MEKSSMELENEQLKLALKNKDIEMDLKLKAAAVLSEKAYRRGFYQGHHSGLNGLDFWTVSDYRYELENTKAYSAPIKHKNSEPHNIVPYTQTIEQLKSFSFYDVWHSWKKFTNLPEHKNKNGEYDASKFNFEHVH